MSNKIKYLLIHLGLGVSLAAWYVGFFVRGADPAVTYRRDYKSYLLEGDAWIKVRKYEKAIEAFDEASRLMPESEEAYYRRGDAWKLRGDDRRALEDYDGALRLNPTSGAALARRGQIKLLLGDPRGAIADYDRAIGTTSVNASDYAGRGCVWYSLGEFDRAISDLSESIRRDPADARYRFNRGIVYGHKGMMDEAIADFSEALRFDPAMVLAYYNRAVAYSQRRRYPEAIDDLNKVIEAQSMMARAYSDRGDALLAQRQFDSALRDYDRVLELFAAGNQTKTRATRIETGAESGYQILSSSELGDTGLDVVSVYLNRGEIYEHQGRLDRAIAEYSEAVRRFPARTAALFRRADAFLKMRRPMEAREDLDAAIRLDHNVGILYHKRALTWVLQGDDDRAMADENRALQGCANDVIGDG